MNTDYIKWKIKRSKRNWLKILPERHNRREAAKKRDRVPGKGIFLNSKEKKVNIKMKK